MMLGNEAATEAAGRLLAHSLRVGDVIALSGDLGAGKSCLARGLLAGLGFEGETPSPTFALVIPYDPPAVRLPVMHVDLYRLESVEDALELGLDEALKESALIIEWPERLGSALWPHALKIRLEDAGSLGRRLTACAPPSWEGRCPFQ